MTGVTLVETKDWLALQQELAEIKVMLNTILHGAEKKDPAYTLKQAAEIMNLSYTWVFANKHKIGCSRVGKSWVIKQSSIESFINQSYHKDA
ncbi:MAG: DNA-binding protein [Chryseobacterium sp.]|nr:MAG: DNA-binding protein [Chryseobacterium sp.]